MFCDLFLFLPPFLFPSFLPLYLESTGGWIGTNSCEVLVSSWCVEIQHLITTSKSPWGKVWRPFLTWDVYRDSLWLSFCLLSRVVDLLIQNCLFYYFTVSATLFFLWFFSAYPDLLILKIAACYWAPGMEQTCSSFFMTCKSCDL